MGGDMRRTASGSATQEAALGEIYVDKNGNTYRYMQADGAVTSYLVYQYVPGTWQITDLADGGANPADTNTIPCCVWDGSSTALADDEFAWVFVGPGEVTVTNDSSGAIAAEEILYLSADAGDVTNVATAGTLSGSSVQASAAIAGDATGTVFVPIGLFATDLP